MKKSLFHRLEEKNSARDQLEGQKPNASASPKHHTMHHTPVPPKPAQRSTTRKLASAKRKGKIYQKIYTMLLRGVKCRS